MVSTELLPDLIPGLPEEIGNECLTRFHYSTHSLAVRVCRRWQELLQSKELYYHRKRTGYTQKAACLIQSLKCDSDPDGSKPVGPPRYGITAFEPCGTCSYTSSQHRGGDKGSRCRKLDPSLQLVSWMDALCGHDEHKNALRTAWEYDARMDEWKELKPMSEERDECQGVMIGSEFGLMSGYRTYNQGQFEGSAEVMELETGQWVRVEEAWKASQCPRSCVGVGKEKKLFSWAGCDSAIRVGVCSAPLGEWTFVSGSAHQGGPTGFFLVDQQTGKFNTIDEISHQFSGFIQSGCCVDI
ncbi:hypothetical protein Golob_011851 [Gossypium lobatum]|uniref:F-box domain-containing protein n=1 Tax=Gossypium lobatum TaxID=34289 RepID=A0A7J8MR98_9ROSI|nr:hypothetical protein [Gossypium lobatum]